MVEIETVRSFRIEGNDFIAVKTDSYENGKGKKVVRMLEEHNISEQEIDEVINKLSTEELAKVSEEKDKLVAESKEMRKDIKKVIECEKFKAFKESLKTKQSKRFFEVLAKEKALSASDARVKELDKTTEDVVAWKNQFEELKQKINE